MVAVATIAISAVALAGSASFPKPGLAGLPILAAGAGLAALLHRALAHIVQLFVFVDYDKHHPSKLPSPR